MHDGFAQIASDRAIASGAMSTRSGPTQLPGCRRGDDTPSASGNRLEREPTTNRAIGWPVAAA